jgi:SOS-response transcriptional repressor LexA
MALPADKLRQDLLSFFTLRDRGAPAELARLARVSPATLSNLTREQGYQQRVSFETWLKLHRAAPAHIRPPQAALDHELNDSLDRLRREGIVGDFLADTVTTLADPEKDRAELVDDQQVRVPVFPCGAGAMRFWTDAGHPVGFSEEYISLPRRMVDQNTFAVRAHGDSMSPELEDGQIAVVDPNGAARNGDMVFVTWPGEDGGRVVRWFFRVGEVVRLRPENPAYPEETLDRGSAEGVRVYPVIQILRPPRWRSH